jgi:hypothetical protein
MKSLPNGCFELDEQEIDLAMKIGDRLKTEFAVVVQAAIDAGTDSGVPDQCVMSAICTETLLLAAFCHNGTPDSFRQMVEFAMTAAARHKADPNDEARIQ